MLRKICPIGNSFGVSIPKEILTKLHLKAGSQVEVNLDEETNKIIIDPAITTSYKETIDIEFASQVKEFIEHYRPALKSLSQK